MEILSAIGSLLILALRGLAAIAWFISMGLAASRGLNRLAQGPGPKPVPRTVRSITIKAIVGDLLEADTEAIVNAANTELWMGGGVAGAIKAAAGDAVERDAMSQGPIQPGDAVVTSAGDLRPPIRWVIHAATMEPGQRASEDVVTDATTSALERAAEVGAESIAYPALGTGVGGLNLIWAARAMVDAARGSAYTESSVQRIVFVLRDQRTFEVFRDQLAEGESGEGESP